ncbi:hypothetical protein [Kribbella voronezhensis]|uniref:hypothetical protein n=1 Tax=Kribbella voronezhensis TaxID=2512212 RepID=UPI001416F115|nr:hypothetical protein [Kribbella voronezhensis]
MAAPAEPTAEGGRTGGCCGGRAGLPAGWLEGWAWRGGCWVGVPDRWPLPDGVRPLEAGVAGGVAWLFPLPP